MRNAGVLVFVATMLVMPQVSVGRDVRVPADYDTIQSAVDDSLPGDTILVEAGVYFEHVLIKERHDLILSGAEPYDLSSGESCWDTVAQHATDIVISGSIEIESSQNITIECLTIVGSGPGIRINGSSENPALDVMVRYSNLLYNDGPCLDFGKNYYRVIVSCCNINADRMYVTTTKNVLSGSGIHVTCTRVSQYTNPSSLALAPITVAVIDSGIDRSIPALSCYMWKNPGEIPGNGIDDEGNGYVDDVFGWDFTDHDSDSLSGTAIHWHGTFVAGVLANTFEAEARAMSSVSSPSLRIMDLRVLNSSARFSPSEWQNIADAIEYAVHNGARIINLSIYGTSRPPESVREAIALATEQRVLVVGIAGNDANQLRLLASWPEILTVAAVDQKGAHAEFSNTGTEVDYSALGVNVLSLLPGG
ncbi:S8 family serine peptidase, partial [Candidatus Bipolaricaulota bacterium]